MNSKRELSIDVVHEQLISTIYEQSILPVDDTKAEDLIVSCRTQWGEQLSCRWMSDESWCYEMDVHERGTWQLCHVRRLAFPLNISCYLMQHTPLWRSKFGILRIKKTRTKIETLRISHTSSKPASPGHPIRELHKDQLEENRSYYWQSLVTEYSIQV